MKYLVFLLSLMVVLYSACASGGGRKIYPNRWMYVSRGLNKDSNVEDIRKLVTTASEHGLNGMMLSAGFDRLDLAGPDYFRRLEEVKKICAEKGIEIIPTCLGIGYNGALLSHDRNLAAGIPVKDALFVVKKGEAVHVSELKEGFTNKSFEKYGKDGFPGWEFAGPFGEVVFADKEVVVDGKTSVRFENFYDKENNPGRLIKKVKVIPDRLYRLTFWVKTEGINESDPFGSGNFRVNVKGGERQLTFYRPRVGQNTDWTEVVVGFNSRDYDEVEISIGMHRAESGRFWLDGMNLEEIGMSRLLRRGGTPLVVRGEKSGTVYEEGRDFEKVEDTARRPRFRNDGPSIKLTKNSRIKPGERLRVSFYHGVTVYQGQVTACMSEPEVYEIWRTNAKLIHQHLAPEKYFLKHDEIRAGGACEACKSTGMTMGEMLGNCITRQMAMVREINPEAEFYVWSDMLDPNHNAGDRGGKNYYYHVDQTFTGSWLHVPEDLVMVAWWHKMRRKSLDHFSGLGFRTMGAGYYDADILTNDSTWVTALDSTRGALGLMYTTWLKKYDLLDEFGDLLSRR